MECVSADRGVMNVTFWCSNSVAFRVEKATNLGEITVTLDDEIEHGRLHQKREVAFNNTFNTLLVVGNEDRWLLVFHIAPHFLISFDARILL